MKAPQRPWAEDVQRVCPCLCPIDKSTLSALKARDAKAKTNSQDALACDRPQMNTEAAALAQKVLSKLNN
ncbi:hypothetical protein EYF80_029556 [Liparis tanakae]|uniref:Uncharacterized protein n=1 Tax=Liparis tanakae TaxID=230148 RepID=A0A4Z2H3N6_9TELE|nr:hypothetical protein EYF80_029556 [Liparis tanakae]